MTERRFQRATPWLAMITVAALLAAGPTSAVEGTTHGRSRPSIAAVSATGITRTQATLTARINPEGSETTYVFEIGYIGCQGVEYCEFYHEQVVREGNLASGITAKRVSARLTHLEPGYEYEYSVVATNAEGTSESSGVFIEKGKAMG